MSSKTQDLGPRLAAIKGAKLVKSFCYTCPWQCPTEVYVRNEKIVYQKAIQRRPITLGRVAQKAWQVGGYRVTQIDSSTPCCARTPKANQELSGVPRGMRHLNSLPQNSKQFVKNGAPKHWP